MSTSTIRHHTIRWLIAALVLAILLLLAASVASGCPTCKNALDSDESGGDVVRGYFWSILFMMSMPFAVLGSFSGYLYLLVRRARSAAMKKSLPPHSKDISQP